MIFTGGYSRIFVWKAWVGSRTAARLASRKLTLELSEDAYSLLANEGYDPSFGARPLKRLLQRELENPLARKLLAGEVREGDTVRVTVANGRLELGRA